MRKLFASLLLVFVPLGIFAQPLWQDVKENSIPVRSERLVIPTSYRTVHLDAAALTDLLTTAPMEFTASAKEAQVVLTVPMPDGSFARFRMQESPISLPDPSGADSDFRSYSGQGIDDPTATLRCDFSPAGFHAQILSSGESVYVDPYANGDTTNCISYYRRDSQRTGTRPECFASDHFPAANNAALSGLAKQPGLQTNGPNGSMLRQFRTAIAVTGEYTAFFRQAPDSDDQAKARALNAIKITMNRVTGIWERDIAIRYVLLADVDELKIIYTNGATDPYTNNDANALSNENQTNLDNVIGNANYDIGHVFATSLGGIGGGAVCVTGQKAQGATGLPNPVGDAFDVDFVAHEIIHQYQGGHTFNESAAGQCNSVNRDPLVAYEPGSGSTVASYAGTCDTANLQALSDDYFHGGSIQQVLNFVAGTATCAIQTATLNTPPTVTAPAAFTIPQNTPFTLTATGSDPDGDALTFGWEEFDIGTASPPNSDDGSRPLFRPYKPVASPSRTFPSLQYILNNANNPPPTITVGGQTFFTGEVMPTTTRTMKFRVQVRDNRAGGGGINDATTLVNVRAQTDGGIACGPFVVTAPNTAVTVTGGSQMTVTWNVANTTAAPVSAANVKISLSTDGGNTFPNVLAASTANNGSSAVTLPNVSTTTARIKVEAVGNIFFDISDTNFTITGNGVTPGLVANVSTRLPVGQDPNALFQGFIVQGPVGSTKKILVRGLGPFLEGFGITDFLENPTLDIFDVNQVKVASNDNWKTTQVGGLITGDQFAEINASGLAPTKDPESAIIANLAPGQYTAVVRGSGNSVGTGLVDAFDISAASPARLVNVGTRGLVQPGDGLLTAGFIVQNGSVRVVIRAVGPSLVAFGITNALLDTTLQLRDGNGTVVRENDDWMIDQKAELEATGLQPSNIKEAALVQTIPPGSYTAQVRGKPEGTGIGVVEVYFLQ